MASNRPKLNFRRRPYRQGIFENLSRQENLTLNRFTSVKTFFLEINVEVSNFYQSCPRPPVSTGLR